MSTQLTAPATGAEPRQLADYVAALQARRAAASTQPQTSSGGNVEAPAEAAVGIPHHHSGAAPMLPAAPVDASGMSGNAPLGQTDAEGQPAADGVAAAPQQVPLEQQQQQPQDAAMADVVDLTQDNGTQDASNAPPAAAADPGQPAAAPASANAAGTLATLRRLISHFMGGDQHLQEQAQAYASGMTQEEVARAMLLSNAARAQQQQQAEQQPDLHAQWQQARQQQQAQQQQQQHASQQLAQYVNAQLEQQQQQQRQQQQQQVTSGWGQPPIQSPPRNPLMSARQLPTQQPSQQQQQQQSSVLGVLQALGVVPAEALARLSSLPLPPVLQQQLLAATQQALQAQQAQQVAEASRARRMPALLGGQAVPGGLGAKRAPGAAGLPPAWVPPARDKEKEKAVKAVLDGLSLSGTDEERDPPEGMLLTPLLRHQRQALAWMMGRESGRALPMGGILADDQGLGKTVSTIALIITNKPRGQGQLTLSRAASEAALAAAPKGTTPGRKRPRKLAAVAAGDSGSDSEAISGDEYPSSSSSSSGEDEGEGSQGGSPAAASAAAANGAAAPNGMAAAGAAASPAGTAAAPSPAREREVVCLDGASEPEEEEEEEECGRRLQGGTLVVCPTTVLHQWAAEIRSKVSPNAGITVHVYHGKGKAISAHTLCHYGVVLTTYQTMALEAPRREAAAGDSKAQRSAAAAAGSAAVVAAAGGAANGVGSSSAAVVDLLSEDDEPGQPQQQQKPATKRQKVAAGKAAAGGGKGKGGGPLYDLMWHRVVLDEAQCIKNARTLAAHAAWSLKAGSRWCLSGTPLQNSVDDLFSYFKFLKYDPYDKQNTFKTMLRDPIQMGGEQGKRGFQRLHAVLQNVVLRRSKTGTIDGKPIVDLPPRLVQLVKAPFSPEERTFYNHLKEEAAQEIKRLQEQAGGAGQHYVGVLWQLLRMRQACNHPLLVKPVGASKQAVPAPELAAARRLQPHIRATLADLLRPEHLTPCVVCGDVPEDAVVSVCAHIFCAQCVATQISNAGHGAAEAELAFHCPAVSCRHALGKHDTHSAQALQSASSSRSSAAAAAAQQQQQQQQVQQQRQQQLQPKLEPGAQQPKIEAGQAGQAGATTGAAPKWGSSAKLDALMGVLRTLRDKVVAAETEARQQRSVLTSGRSLSHARLAAAMGGGAPRVPTRGAGAGGSGGSRGASPRLPMEKVIVFSQWTAMLDLAEAPLRRENFQFRRLDGTMSVKARQAAIEDFCRRPEVAVMLVSLKAASLGVNLVSANHVVLLDLWYNPTVEEQAIDRAHRIGQTRPVHVTRITIEDSIEDKILELQDRKRGVIASAFGEDGAEGGGGGFRNAGLTAEDIKLLFS